MPTDVLPTEATVLAQDIANDLVDLAHWVRATPTDARDQVPSSEEITAKLQKLYNLVGMP
jgi:hypothetical protein